jgi:DNA polymerase-3 subunit alpha
MMGAGDSTPMQSTITLVTSPTRHTDRERLMWERELMGLYISAHPLDNYTQYFEEQTIPLSQVKPELDSKQATIGGIITTVRTIVTKSGTKMAFVGLEDKTGEGEIIVFPNLYEQVGAKLVQDAVIRASGKISAKDRDGNIGKDAKMIADEIQFVTDQELESYESTGRKMEKPKPRKDFGKVKATRTMAAAASKPKAPATEYIKPQVETVIKSCYVQVKDPEDHEALLNLKKICSEFPGLTEIILVLGEDKKSAIKMPFKVDASDALVSKLVKILGEDAVVLK